MLHPAGTQMHNCSTAQFTTAYKLCCSFLQTQRESNQTTSTVASLPVQKHVDLTPVSDGDSCKRVIIL